HVDFFSFQEKRDIFLMLGDSKWLAYDRNIDITIFICLTASEFYRCHSRSNSSGFMWISRRIPLYSRFEIFIAVNWDNSLYAVSFSHHMMTANNAAQYKTLSLEKPNHVFP